MLGGDAECQGNLHQWGLLLVYVLCSDQSPACQTGQIVPRKRLAGHTYLAIMRGMKASRAIAC